MKIKKYEASDMKEAVRMIKDDLGPDAVILSTRKVVKQDNKLGLFARPILEVTAAIDYKPSSVPAAPARALKRSQTPAESAYASYGAAYSAKSKLQKQMPKREEQTYGYKPYPETRQAPVKRENLYDEDEITSDDLYPDFDEAPPKPAYTPTVNRYTYEKRAEEYHEEPKSSKEDLASVISALGLDKLPALMNEVIDIKKQLSDMKSNIGGNMVIDLAPRLKEYHAQLMKNGVDDIVSYRLLKNIEKKVCEAASNAQAKDIVAESLAGLIAVEKDFKSVIQKRILALSGPTGVGKTTTIAKIAATMALKYKAKVCLITVDNYRIGAIEQLKTYAEIVNIPLYVAASPQELKLTLKEAKQGYDCILIDSMGRSQFDTDQIKAIREFLNVDDKISAALVLSLASNHAELSDVMDRYSVIDPEYLIFTKLDETRYFGPLINLPIKKKIPLLLFSTGQNVPDDMEVPDGKKIAKRVLQDIPALWSDK